MSTDTHQQSWSRVMLALLIGVPAMGYVVYYMRKHKPKPDSVDGSDSSKKPIKTDSVEKSDVPIVAKPEVNNFPIILSIVSRLVLGSCDVP